jgi:hypothetical protein
MPQKPLSERIKGKWPMSKNVIVAHRIAAALTDHENRKGSTHYKTSTWPKRRTKTIMNLADHK